ncbi:sulfurtransferase [Candidatus Endoriftia persephone str. Guaymas]|nr:sulfurtransferase [Candidatus Endoriftia persephone str. Guaymas]
MRRLGLLLFMVPWLLLPARAADRSVRLVDDEWLSGRSGQAELLILDVREPQAYQQGHLPGAVNLPVNSIFGLDPRSDLMAPTSTIQRVFSTAGIDVSQQLVVYDSGTFIDAARLIWILEVHGHARVALKDGGYESWLANGKAISFEASQPQARRFIPTADPQRIASKLSTRLAIDNPEVVLIDARTPEEFAGEVSGAKRFGHIPTAINIPWDANYERVDGQPKLKPLSELRALYAGIGQNKRIITYCNRGKQSALTYFVLRQLGYAAAAYGGSWFEWSNDPALPIERDGDGAH